MSRSRALLPPDQLVEYRKRHPRLAGDGKMHWQDANGEWQAMYPCQWRDHVLAQRLPTGFTIPSDLVHYHADDA